MFRKARYEDLDELLLIYKNARVFMRNTGNKNQWNENYPNKEILSNDIDKNRLYIYEEEEILAVFMFEIGEDPTYKVIKGSWIEDSSYGVIHRVASSGKRRNVFDDVVEYCETLCTHLRIDTHEDNVVMQKAILRNGFKECGIIYLENKEPRIAYEKVG